MSRSGYTEECDDAGALNLWRGAVGRAIKGKRGQAFFRDMKEALEALPRKRLIAGDLVRDGEVCAMGAVAVKRGLDVSRVDPTDRDQVASLFNIAPALAAEISYENDEGGWHTLTPEQRWERIHKWVVGAQEETVTQ